MKVWVDINVYGPQRFHASNSSPDEMPYGVDEHQMHLLTNEELEQHERAAFYAGMHQEPVDLTKVDPFEGYKAQKEKGNE